MAEVHDLKIRRGAIKGRVTRLRGYFDTIDKDNLDQNIVTQLSIRLEKVEPVWDEFNDLQTLIELQDPSNGESDRADFEEPYSNLIGDIKSVINRLNKTREVKIAKVKNLYIKTSGTLVSHYVTFRQKVTWLLQTTSNI